MRPLEATVPGAQKRIIRIEDQVQLQTLAQRMSLKATDVLMELIQQGVTNVHINSTLDADTATLLASVFNYEVENVARTEDEIVGDARGDFENLEEDRLLRAPVVTVMGHVDHGKTSLLDKIRNASVAAGEAGGITQHIGAYRVGVQLDGETRTIVFLDTPGHEAFTAMRARGADATDVVILVVAADDGIMPQTREAITHAKSAQVPIVVALNKCDREDAQPERVKHELASLGLQPEEWGGDTIYVETSAHTGLGIEKLLESVLLQAEILDLQSNPNIPAEGVVLEAKLDRGRGPVANVLVRDGTLKPGDYVVAGQAWGRVRAMMDERGSVVKVAGPATPVEILGLQDLPSAGDMIYQVKNQKKAAEVAESYKKAGGKPVQGPMSGARGLEEFQKMMNSGDVEELRLVVKADVQGSLEALKKSLAALSTEKVKVNIILSGVGGITENDIMLASGSNALVIGFNVRPQGKGTAIAKKENVDVRNYSIIYEALDDVRAAMRKLLAPTYIEKELGKAQVRMVFSIPKAGTIAGSMVTDGKILRSGKARLLRNGEVLFRGDVASLRRHKDDVKEVGTGFECGIGLAGFNDMAEGDIIEAYELIQVEATL
ncbi:MAG: translation initiation factor IF-2 [Polyangiales bacterium]